MKNLYKRVKAFVDAYKMWLFLIALFGTNGMQAYLSDTTPVETIVIEEEVDAVPAKQDHERWNPTETKVVVKLLDCGSNIREHEKEHHGGR